MTERPVPGPVGPATKVECPLSQRVDGQFDGDDPRVFCHWCDEMRDALTGKVIRGGRHA